MKNDVAGINDIMEKLKTAVGKYSDCVEAYALYAKVLQETGRIDEADEMYRKGMELNPDNSNLIVHRALLHLQRTGDVTKTLSEIERAIKVDSKCEFAYETIGQLEIQRDNMEAAVRAFDKVNIAFTIEITIIDCSKSSGHSSGQYRARDGPPLRTERICQCQECCQEEITRFAFR